jgi:hypothetical protein
MSLLTVSLYDVSAELRGTENQKIHCGERQFGALGVDYKAIKPDDPSP